MSDIDIKEIWETLARLLRRVEALEGEVKSLKGRAEYAQVRDDLVAQLAEGKWPPSD